MTENKVFKTLFQMVKEEKLTESEFAEFIRSVASDGVKEAGTHVCTLPKGLRDAASHLEIALETIGHGNISKGVETVKENHQFVALLRKSRDRVGNMIFGFIVLSFLAGALYVFKDFFKDVIK